MLKTLMIGLLFVSQVFASSNKKAENAAVSDPGLKLTQFFEIKQQFKDQFFQVFNTYVTQSKEVFQQMDQMFQGREALNYSVSCQSKKQADACVVLEALYAETFRQYDQEVFAKFQTSLFKMTDDFNIATADLEKKNGLVSEMAQSTRDFLLFVFLTEAKRKGEAFLAMQKVSLFKDKSNAFQKNSAQRQVMSALFQGIAQANEEVHAANEKYTF